MTTSSPESAQAQPSWRGPILWGSFVTMFVHAPVVLQHLLWVVVLGVFGATGLLIGVLPVWLASRREELGAMSGFSLAFIASGLGMIVLVSLTLLPGFVVTAEQEELWREALLSEATNPGDVDTFFASLRSGSGEMIAVLAATCVAFTAGFSGGITALWRGRRRS